MITKLISLADHIIQSIFSIVNSLSRKIINLLKKKNKQPTFWESPTLEELAKSQNIKPLKDVNKILNTWPGEIDDGFEELIDELRNPKTKKRK